MADEPWGPGKGCLDPPAVDATDAHGFGPLSNGRTGGDPGPAPVYIGGGEDTLPRKEGGDTGPGGAIAIGRGGDMVPGGRTNVGGRGAPAVIDPNKCWRAMADAPELDDCAPRGGGEDGTTAPAPLAEAQGFVCPEGDSGGDRDPLAAPIAPGGEDGPGR